MADRLLLAVGVLVLALAGCAAPGDPTEPISAPTPTAAPPEELAPTAPEWEPDLIVVREFTDENGDPVACTLFRRIPPVESGSPLAEQVALAQRFLHDGDWSSVGLTLDALPSDELVSRRAQGVSDAQLYMMVLGQRISDDFAAAGHDVEGMSVEGFVHCD